MKKRSYTITDGKLVLELTSEGDGWFSVRAPFVQGVNTQARSVEEAFEMAYDAWKELKLAQRQLDAETRRPARRKSA